MNCRTCRRQLVDVVDAMAGARRRRAVLIHVERCPGCRRDRDALVRLKALLEPAPATTERPDFWERACPSIHAASADTEIRRRERERSAEKRRPGPVRYAYLRATTAMVIATLVQMILSPVLLERAPSLSLLAGVLFCAWRLGFGPAMQAVAFATLACDYFFTRPHLSFAIDSAPTAIQIAVCFAVGLAVAVAVPRTRFRRLILVLN